MKLDIPRRPCSACASVVYARSCRWSFVGGPHCICCACSAAGWTFDARGRVVKASHLALAAALAARATAKEKEGC